MFSCFNNSLLACSLHLVRNSNKKFRGTQRFEFVSGNISSEGQRFSDLLAVKARDLFGERSPQTFVTTGLISSYCFWRDKYVV